MKSIISFAIRYIPRKYLQLFSHWVAKFLALFYVGNNVECNVCQHHYREFLPYGRKGRSNALCPNCLALERHRMMWYFLEQRTNFFTQNLDVLHIAPELCFIEQFEAIHQKRYITADIESPLAKVKLDVLNMPFEENTYDVVFCNHVMEHVADDKKAMAELFRVLRPGGWGIAQIPLFHPIPEHTYEDASITSAKEREKVFGQSDHVRLYGKDYTQRLSAVGFKAEEIWMKDLLDESTIKKFALPLDEPIFFIKKPLDSQ
jgi:SAM-dependent methyltransferase